MRTKLFLAAAAALAAGIVASNAQVTSANIVGYASQQPGVNSTYTLICNPVDSGSNTVKNLFANTPPPGGTSLLLWNGSGYVQYQYSAALGGHWKVNGNTADSSNIPPGQGFFIQISGATPYTNTFVGQVTPLTGVSATNSVPAGYQLISSSLPYSDYVTNPTTINLTGVAGGTVVLLWNQGSQGFDQYSYSAALGGHWKLNGVNNTPFLNVGQGFFLNSAGSYNWVQTGP